MAGVILNSESTRNPGTRRFAAVLAAVLSLIVLQGCSLPTRLNAVPKDIEATAEIPGMPGVRYWQESDLDRMVDEAYRSYERQLADWKAAGNKGPMLPASFLAISGGGENGAYGAGLLCGWTEAGTRPTFKLVTGISTGALTAPFAFLGPAYDEKLREVYTQLSGKDVLEERGFMAALFDDAMADNAPLRATIARYFDQPMLDAIAEEYRKGRILLIGTTNLDARRPVIWDIGAIAERRDPGALDLVHDILLASAAIPGAFPPVMIKVNANGKIYEEMHVDGGASTQVFVYPPSLEIGSTGIKRDRHLYVIRNARLDPDWAQVERSTMSIAGRAISSLIQTQGVGDLYRI